MRNADGTLNGDLNDNTPAYTSGSINRYVTSSLNENETSYDLLPVIINRPPIILEPITVASNPPIKPYSVADATGTYMHLFPDGNVKLNLGVNITLAIKAQQPNIYNVENGIPTIIPPNSDLKYVWRKDGLIITSYEVESLGTQLVISGSTLSISNTHPEHAGTYTCEVQNDIGITSSEPITLEIYNLDFDDYFYKNLVKNPYGKEGTDEWQSLNNDFISKTFSKTPSTEYLKPNRTDIFGYTPDMLFPRPYQIDTGVIKNLDMTKELVLEEGSYFTRTRYEYIQNDGNYLVRAYQDIDLTEIQPLIKGGIFGVEGVRAIFSCYIGNALQGFVPTTDLVNLGLRYKQGEYVRSRPRISVENFLQAGGGLPSDGRVYVTIEEYNNDTRLPSVRTYPGTDRPDEVIKDKVVLDDPWYKDRFLNLVVSPGNGKYYDSASNGDPFGIGESSPGGYSSVDANLFIADKFFPDVNKRFTFGQYIEFNKVVFERLNPKTTKVRITLNFELQDSRMFFEGPAIRDVGNDLMEFVSWGTPQKKHSWKNSPGDSIYTILKNATKKDKNNWTEFMPAGGDPRGVITGLNFSLLPILKQNRSETDYYTQNSLVQNDSPATSLQTMLVAGRGYDPYNTNSQQLLLNFKFKTAYEPMINNQGLVESVDVLEFEIKIKDSSGSFIPYPITNQRLLPFDNNTSIAVESMYELAANVTGSNPLLSTGLIQSPLTAVETSSIYIGNVNPPNTNESNNLYKYLKIRYISGSNIQNKINNPKASLSTQYSNYKGVLDGYSWITDSVSGSTNNTINRTPNVNYEVSSYWNNVCRYAIILAKTPKGSDTNTYLDQTYNSIFLDYNAYALQQYFLDINFSDPNNTKVVLARSEDMRPGTGRLISYLSHSIEGGILKCKLSDSVLYNSLREGGLGFEQIRSIVPVEYGGDGQANNGNGLGSLRSPAKLSQSLVTISDHPIETILSLHRNVGDYSRATSLSVNRYYQDKLKDILEPIERDLQPIRTTFEDHDDNFFTPNIAVQTGGNSSPFSLSELGAFSSSLVSYANNELNFINTNQLITTSSTSSYSDINNYYNSTFKIQLVDDVFSTPLPGYVQQGPVLDANFGVRPITHLINSRMSGSVPSLAGVRSVDPQEFGDGVASPTAGQDSTGVTYIINYGPIQDTVAGTYIL